jgi:hypothetical protein
VPEYSKPLGRGFIAKRARKEILSLPQCLFVVFSPCVICPNTKRGIAFVFPGAGPGTVLRIIADWRLVIGGTYGRRAYALMHVVGCNETPTC